MQRMKSGPAAVDATASPVEKPSRPVKSHQTAFDSTTTHKQRHPRTYEAPLRTWTDVLAFVLFVALAVATVFIAGYMVFAALFVISQIVTG